MNELTNYGEEIEDVFAQAAATIAGFPPRLSDIGLAMLESQHPIRRRGRNNAICCLLPFWFRESCPSVSPQALSDFAVGNVFAMLHFGLLDDAMDGQLGENKADEQSVAPSALLALGQLLHSAFMARYLAHVPPSSSAWQRYSEYLQQWAAAVSTEGRTPADFADARALAGKAAPVKLTVAALLALDGGNGWNRLPAMERAVELSLATLQLADDWADWREDLTGNAFRNAFLTIVTRDWSNDANHPPLDERTVKQAIYRYEALSLLADQAETFGAALAESVEAPPPLLQFQRTVARGIRTDAETASKMTRQLASGTWAYFL